MDEEEKVEVPKYLRNIPPNAINHPIDRNIAWSFVLSVIFVAVAIVTGFPIVGLMIVLLPLAVIARQTTFKLCTCKKGTCNGQKLKLVSPADTFWLHDSDFNRYIGHCLFFFDSELTVSRIRDIVLVRVLNRRKDDGQKAFPRFTQRILRLSAGYCWCEDNDFNVENHIYEDDVKVRTKKQLRIRLSQLMMEPLPSHRPLWEIRLVRDYGGNSDTVLIVRVHQAVSDGISLIKILTNCLSDTQQPIRMKPRFGGTTFPLNVFRALVVGPLTFIMWLIFTKRDYNFFSRGEPCSKRRVVAWSRDIRLSKVLRIKQVTRSCLNDILLTATTGAVREYCRKHGPCNPPDVTVSLPVDLSYEPSAVESIPEMGNKIAIVNTCLPTNKEGVIPRLWEVRHYMEELKTSADPVVMYGAIYFLIKLLPHVLSHWLLGLISRKATVNYSNLPGPSEFIVLGSRKLKKFCYWMACNPNVPVSFSLLTYGGNLTVAVSADQTIVTTPKDLIKNFIAEINKLAHLLAKRRIPGEQRRRSSYTSERRQEEIIKPPMQQLQQKLNLVQEELHEVGQKFDMLNRLDSSVIIEYKGVPISRSALYWKLEELKEEFSELLAEMRRRKSLADGIIINIEDEDMDGEVRRPRRRALSTSGRRASFSTIASTVSTARPLTTPTMTHHSSFLSPSRLDINYSPNNQHRNAQGRMARRASENLNRERIY
ncbi:putative diacyglycerol O-acyltransferase MT1468 isoform X1 [Centruroides vittatus]|uniref:putative diacyglycerol O-acyltransferase MT1468 isoform X1 n=1 Tax=Centruroides vittatus TaxID=120091 RepID=UPI00350EF87D